MALCTCLCLSVSGASRSSIETADESSWFSAWELPSTYTTLCFKEIRIPLEINSVFPSETCRKLRTLKFFHGRSIALSTKLVVVVVVVVDGRACWRHPPIRQSTSRGCLLQVGQLVFTKCDAHTLIKWRLSGTRNLCIILATSAIRFWVMSFWQI